MTAPPAIDTEVTAIGEREALNRLAATIDSVYVLAYDGWEEELESNRRHYARRWARHFPVTVLQPRQRLWRLGRGVATTAIDNCELLPIAGLGGYATYPLRAVVQAAQVMDHMRKRGHSRPLLWCSNPFLVGLYAAVPARARVYHASENHFDYSHMPDLFRREFEAALRLSDLVIPVSTGVADGISARVPEAPMRLVSNGCDTSQYQPTGQTHPRLADERDGVERVAVFAGNINDRLDFGLVARVAEENEKTLIVFAGPVGKLAADGRDLWRRILERPNVRHLGRLAPDELAALYRSADLGFIPYRRDPLLVRNGFPLKTLEMAATGLPVVATHMEPIVGLAAAISVAEDDGQFLESFASVARSTLGEDASRELLEVAAANDYDRKFEQVVGYVAAAIPADRDVHTRLDDLLLHLGHEPWRESSLRIFERTKPSFLRYAAGVAYGSLGNALPDRVRELLPASLRDPLRRRFGE